MVPNHFTQAVAENRQAASRAASVAGRASNEFLAKLTIEAAQTRALHYFPAALTCSSMSALIRFSASSSDISPTIA